MRTYMSDNNQLSKQQELFLALREQAKQAIHTSTQKGKLITPEELHTHLSTFAKEHYPSEKPDIVNGLQQANRDLVHEYVSGKIPGVTSDDLPISLSTTDTHYNVAQDYIINSVLLKNFANVNINDNEIATDKTYNVAQDMIINSVLLKSFADLNINQSDNQFDPEHHITPEELLEQLQKEGLNDIAQKIIPGDKGKDFIVGDVHGGTSYDSALKSLGFPEHMKNAMRIPDSKYGVNIPESLSAHQDMKDITAFHDANEDNVISSKGEPEYKKRLREYLENSPKFIHTDEEDAKPWYLSPEEINSMTRDAPTITTLFSPSGLSKEAVKKQIQETSDKLNTDNNPDKPKNSI